MNNYKVVITDLFERTVNIEAPSADEARRIAQNMFDFILLEMNENDVHMNTIKIIKNN